MELESSFIISEDIEESIERKNGYGMSRVKELILSNLKEEEEEGAERQSEEVKREDGMKVEDVEGFEWEQDKENEVISELNQADRWLKEENGRKQEEEGSSSLVTSCLLKQPRVPSLGSPATSSSKAAESEVFACSQCPSIHMEEVKLHQHIEKLHPEEYSRILSSGGNGAENPQPPRSTNQPPTPPKTVPAPTQSHTGTPGPHTCTMAGQRLTFGTPETPQCRFPQAPSASPVTDTENKLLSAISGLSQQITQLSSEINTKMDAMDRKLLSVDERGQRLEERMATVEAKINGGSTEEGFKRKRRVHDPKIAETVRRLHNSEANCRRYDPEQGMSSSYNEGVTSYLLAALTASPGLQSEENDVLLSACKTYYETVRRNFRFSQPDLASQAEAMKTAARSRQRRKRLLDARQSVLVAEELDLWKGITTDMMSDEEDGMIDGVSGWIVRRPSFRSHELTDLCARLQGRLEACPKYTATHHRRLCVGPNSDRMPPISYDTEAAKRHFRVELVPAKLLI